jgi:cell division protein FtsB
LRFLSGVKKTATILTTECMDKTTLTKEKELIDILEKELKDLHKQNKALFKNMHKFSKKDFEENADSLAKKIKTTSQKFNEACVRLIDKISNTVSNH